MSKSAADIPIIRYEPDCVDPMDLWQHYFHPDNVIEALQALSTAPGPACVIAGGTDLMLDLQQGRHPPVHTLVDITSIPELTALEIRQGELFIGAAVPLGRIASSTLVLEHAHSLVEACDLIGGPQVRNMATLGGNVVRALPAADGTIALMSLDAHVEMADLEKRRRVPLSNLFAGPGETTVKDGQELLVGFYISLRAPHQSSAFKRIMRAQGIALPILNLSVWMERQADLISSVRCRRGPFRPDTPADHTGGRFTTRPDYQPRLLFPRPRRAPGKCPFSNQPIPRQHRVPPAPGGRLAAGYVGKRLATRRFMIGITHG